MEHKKIKRTLRVYRWTKRRAFGAKSHRFRLSRALDEKTISKYECDYNFRLPTEYREFLLNVCDGPAGPGYGMFSLATGIEQATDPNPDSLGEDFPYTEFFNPADELEFSENEGDEMYWTGFYRGTLPLCDEGCNYIHLLVVRGPARGQVWLNGMSADAGLIPLAANFDEWYGKWIDHLEAGGNGVWWCQ